MARALEEKLVCSICLEMFGTAVTMPCGHNFCMKCINNHWDKEEKEAPPGEKDYTCPDCRKRFEKRLELRKNVALCSVVELVRSGEVQASGAERETPANGGRCSRHGRPLELYCQEDKMCICCVCTVKECRDHHRILFEEERQRKEVRPGWVSPVSCSQSAGPWRERSALLPGSGSVVRQRPSPLPATGMPGAGTEGAVDKIEQEQATALGQVEENWSQLQDHLAMLTQHRQKAQELLTCVDDMKFLEFLLLPSPGSLGVLPAVEFNVARTVDSTAKILTEVSRLLLEDLPNSLNPKAADAETKGELFPCRPSPHCPRPWFTLWMSMLPTDHRNLTFDPDTANKYLQLSNQNQKAKHTHSPDDLCQDHADRFELWQVLCSQSYSQGRHYWEVRISSHSIILGVTYKKIQRKKRAGRSFSIGLDGLSWGLQAREDCYLAWHEGQSHKIMEPLYKCLGVSLDYGTGVLSFYGIGDKMKLLHSFHCVFTEPLYPVFWLCEASSWDAEATP
uniref:Tripartite motif containing 65 n=1 Tax=Chelydra serpentina TaxID=8475 RepID=A0A8C3SCY0_CHESE